MIDWKKSAEINTMGVEELIDRFAMYPYSTKKIVAICDECGAERILEFHAYRLLCRQCAAIMSRDKRSVSHMGYTHTDDTKNKMSITRTGHEVTQTTRDKISLSLSGRTRTYKECVAISAGKQHIHVDDWEDFVDGSPYCDKFTQLLREQVRDDYGRRCFLCGKTEEENGRKLDVHHDDWNKEQGCNGEDWGLTALCKSCHQSIHTDIWKARIIYLKKMLFSYKLEDN